MDSIPFTQYLRPDGRKQPVTIVLDQDTHDKAEMLMEADWRFEAEVLMSGIVSFTCERREDEDVFYIELVQNGPGVPDAVKRLVESAYVEQIEGNQRA